MGCETLPLRKLTYLALQSRWSVLGRKKKEKKRKKRPYPGAATLMIDSRGLSAAVGVLEAEGGFDERRKLDSATSSSSAGTETVSLAE